MQTAEIGEVDVANFRLLASARFSLRRRGLVLVRGENYDTLSASSNGAGKSTIFDAVMWCLFGDVVYGDPMEVIKNGEKHCEVSVTFYRGDFVYRVVRQLTRGKKKNDSALMLYENGEPISRPHIRDVEAEIVAKFGHDFLSARNTIFCAQNDTSDFSSAAAHDAHQKKVLRRILRFDILEAAKKKAEAEQKKLKPEVERLERELARYDGLLSGTSGDTSRAMVDRLKRQLAEVPKMQAKIVELEKERGGVRDLLRELAAGRSELVEVRKKRDDVRRKQDKMISAQQVRIEKIAEIDLDIAKWESGGCPVCGSPADDDHEEARLYLEGKTTERAELERLCAVSRQEMGGVIDELKTLGTDISQLEEQLSDESDWMRKDADLYGRIKSLQRDIATAQAGKTEITRLNAANAARDAQRKEAAAKIVEAKVALQTFQEEIRQLDFWVHAFGNSGIASQLLDSVAPTLTEYTNYWLSILSDDYIRVIYDTQRETKGGKVKDEMDLITIIGGEEAPPSGGERRKISAATRIALWQLAREREGADVDLLVIDEALDHLDPKGMERIELLLLKLREFCSSIYVITHDQRLVEIFEQEVLTQRRDNTSILIDEMAGEVLAEAAQ